MIRVSFILIACLFTSLLNAHTVVDSLIRLNKHEPDSIKVKHYLEFAGRIQHNDYLTCVAVCNEALQLCEKNNLVNSAAETYLVKGLCNYFAAEYDETLRCYLEAIQYFEKGHQQIGKARVLNELGVFYRRQKNEVEANRCFDEAFQISSALNDEHVMATTLNNQGVSAQDQGHHREAIVFFSQAKNLLEKFNDSIGISYTMDYSSVSLAQLGDFEQAHLAQKNAYQIRIRLNDSNAAALSLANLGEIEWMQHHVHEAQQYYLDCLQISEKISSKDLTAYCYNQLAEILAAQGNHQAAYAYHLKYSALNEEIFNEQRSKQINELQTKYETAKKTQQINLLTKENELKEIRHRNQRNLFIALLLLLGSLAWVYYNYFKHKKQQEIDQALLQEKDLRNNAIIEAEEKERIRIARDLHDGVAQTMVAAKMQLESFIEETSANLDEQTSLKNAFDLVKDASVEVRAISHSMIPNALLKSGLVAAIRDLVQRMGHEKLKIHLEIHGLNTRLNENVETVIFRVLQEIMNNIIKHAQANEITIQLIRDHNELTFTVEDNGVGFDVSMLQQKEGMGLKNIISRIEYLQGTIHIDSSVGRGTTMIIEIPLADNPEPMKSMNS